MLCKVADSELVLIHTRYFCYQHVNTLNLQNLKNYEIHMKCLEWANQSRQKVDQQLPGSRKAKNGE